MATFTLPDPYEDWTERQLKDRLRKLGSALMEWELIAANMGVAPGALDQLSPESRQKVERIMAAYSDGDEQKARQHVVGCKALFTKDENDCDLCGRT